MMSPIDWWYRWAEDHEGLIIVVAVIAGTIVTTALWIAIGHELTHAWEGLNAK